MLPLRRRVTTALFLAMACSLAGAQVQSPKQPETPKEPITVDQLIEGLTKQANTFEAGATDFTLLRPHPLLAALRAGSEKEIADKILGKFTDDAQKDIYIRYHLVYALTHPTGKPVPGDVFVKLQKALPQEIAFTPREDDIFDPPELGKKWKQLIGQCAVTVGYPPFQKWVGPPESFKHMDATQKAKAEPLWAEAQALEKQFKRTIDATARAYNMRVGKTPWMLKQVEGECLYGMVASGEPAMLEAAIKRIGADAAKNEDKAASESIGFFNAAYFDGWLHQYPPEKLKTAAATLKRIAVTGDAPTPTKPPPAKPGAKPGAKPTPATPPSPAGPKKNTLSERAFTVITAMETGNVPSRPSDGKLTRDARTFEPLRKRSVTPSTIDRATIDDAINRAVAALEQIRPPDTDLGNDSYWAVGIDAWVKAQILPGNQALANWAFLSAGEGKYDAWLQKRIGWVACFESTTTYDRAMRLRMLAELPAQRWGPWLKRDATWLTTLMTKDGSFPAGIVEKAPPEGVIGDNANSQYAVLALGAAQRVGGVEIDAKTWKQIDKYWRDAQFPAGHKDAGGWAVRSAKAPKQANARDDFNERVTAAMTAGGVLSLATTERILLGPTRLDTTGKITPELDAGLKWLDSKFAVEAVDGDSDLYYYLWTIQNLGQATGYRKFNNVDWFRDATAVLLNQQGADGLWKGPKGPTVSTSFALLYLYRARGPLAICKVRFGDTEKAPSWNNRPNDLANLTEDITEKLETPTSWQIADLDQPLYELMESATLYLTTDKPVMLADAQVNRLREYIDHGGMLIMAPEGNAAAAVAKSMNSLAKQLYPDREPKKIEADHPINTISRKITTKPPVSIVDNGVRPLIAIIEKDISRDLQANQRKKNDSFDLMTNLYLYSAGRDQRRARVETNYVQPSANAKPAGTISAARVKYPGNFDPEPASLTQLSAAMTKHHKLGLDLAVVGPAELSDKHQVAFLTLTEGAQLPADQTAALRKWVDAGGTLWIDAAGGRQGAVGAVDDLIVRLGFNLDDAQSLGDSPMITGKTKRPGGHDNSNPGIRFNEEGLVPSVRQIKVKDRPAIYVARADIAGGLAGANTWGILGFTPETTRKYVMNSLLELPMKK